MDNAGLVVKIKENSITLVILLVAVIIALKIHQSQEIEIQKINNQKAEEEQKNEILKEIGNLEGKLANLKKNFNTDEATVGMEKIGDLAKSASVQIVRINPVKEIISGVFTKHPYDMSLSARDYHLLGKFISLLENSPDNYMVEDLSINNRAQGESSTISASLTVYTITINK